MRAVRRHHGARIVLRLAIERMRQRVQFDVASSRESHTQAGGASAKPHDAPEDLAPVLGWGVLPSTSTHSQIPRSTFQVSEGTTSPFQTSPPRADTKNDRIQRQEGLFGIPRRQLFKSRAAFHFDSYIRLPSGLFFLCRCSSSYPHHRLRSGLASAILPAFR